MVNSFILFISLMLLCTSIVASTSNNEFMEKKRQEKALGLSGYISGSSSGFGFIPFWKQWTAFLQINIEKNKHKHHGTYFIPSPTFYVYPKDFNGLPSYPQEFHNGISASAFRPLPLLFDDYKTSTTTQSAPNDMLKFDTQENENSHDKTSSNLVAKINEDRRSHKRNAINGKSDEIIATVMEITESNKKITTEALDTSTTDSTDLNSYESTTNEPDITIVPSTTQQSVDIEPTLNYYTGGSPNAEANYIYFTTMYPESQLYGGDSTISRKNSNEFKPSIRYEYKNYPNDVDNHFIPIVGIKKIF